MKKANRCCIEGANTTHKEKCKEHKILILLKYKIKYIGLLVNPREIIENMFLNFFFLPISWLVYW